MSTKHERMQRFINHYRDKTGKPDLDMHDVAKAAQRMGWRMPQPLTALELLAKEFSVAAREEIRYDKVTKRPYRAQHAYPVKENGKQRHLWIDIDGEAPRYKMEKCLKGRRDQMIGDGLQATLDQDHWNRIHPEEAPIQLDFDLTEEIQWRLNAPDEDKKAS